ncbi:hypothetical protein HAZT_HAZT004249 [Hyalella azteca]|nr:hypothetical protein HAZT_HAZT004249 [Hyalella azteca]
MGVSQSLAPSSNVSAATIGSSVHAMPSSLPSPERWKNFNKCNVCFMCGYVARDKTNLRKHLYTHTGEKPYACRFCHYKTTQSSNLHTHMRRHHPEQQFAASLNNDNLPSPFFPATMSFQER